MRATRLRRAARHHLQPLLSAARRRRPRARRPDRRGGLLSCRSPRIASQRPDAGHPASRGPRTVGGDRRPRAGRLGGDGGHLPRPARPSRAGSDARAGAHHALSADLMISADSERPPYRAAIAVALVVADGLRHHPGAHCHLLGRRRVHRGRLHPRHPASAGHAALRPDRPRLGPAASDRRVRLSHQPAQRRAECLRRRAASSSSCTSRCEAGARPRFGSAARSSRRSSAPSPSPTGRTRTRPRSTRSRPSRSPPCAGR